MNKLLTLLAAIGMAIFALTISIFAANEFLRWFPMESDENKNLIRAFVPVLFAIAVTIRTIRQRNRAKDEQ